MVDQAPDTRPDPGQPKRSAAKRSGWLGLRALEWPTWPALGLMWLTLVLIGPSLMVWQSWFQTDATTLDLIRQMGLSVLPDYLLTTLVVGLGVMLGAGSMGLVCATLVTLFDFPGRRWVEWGLLLPLAVPAYIVAFAYTDFLQFSGPLQTAWRDWSGLKSPLWPDVRSAWGAVVVFSVTLYPYVYLLVRAALLERASRLMASARLLGAGLSRRLVTIAWPMSRPALAAGLALVMMETLADYGVASYFGIQTFSAGIFKAWLVMDEPRVAAQLSSILLLCVALVLWLEHVARRRLRFDAQGADAHEHQPHRLRGLTALLALVLCAMPIFMGFVTPAAILLRALNQSETALAWEAFSRWGFNSLGLAAVASVLAIALALAFGSVHRWNKGVVARAAAQWVGLGYALPGTILVVGILTSLSQWDALTGMGLTGWFTSTATALMWAYLIRFTAVAQQSIQSGYTRIPPSLDEASRVLGERSFATFWRVHAPMLKTSMLTGWLLVFVDVMKELPATLVLRPFDSDTLAVVSYQLARDERLGEAALPALALVVVGLLPVLLLTRAMRRTS